MKTVIVALLLGMVGLQCWAQADEGRRGCAATLDEAKYGKKPPTRKYVVTVRWRPAPVGVETAASVKGGMAPVSSDWRPAGFGWLPLDSGANLYYQVSYGPDRRYTAVIMIPDLGFESCTWQP